MADIVDKETRSRMMAGIRQKHTKPERALRRALHARGFRYRLHARNVPGHPDLVFPKFESVLFVHGCFWHRHGNCAYATTPATRTEFWRTKFEANVRRDGIVRETLTRAGWRLAIAWECALRKPDHVPAAADAIAEWLQSDAAFLEIERLRNMVSPSVRVRY